MTKRISVLWTGGWDSTFRVLQLAEETEHIIQPYYVFDFNRPSASVELRTVRKLRSLIIDRYLADPTRLREPIILNRDGAPDLPHLHEAHREIVSHIRLGKQYIWLAALLEAEDLDAVEISIKNGHLAPLFRPFATPDTSMELDRYRLENTGAAVPTLFRRFAFPLLDWTYDEVKNYATMKGWDPILDRTWFCSSPLFDMLPCGTCTPCVQAMERPNRRPRMGPAAYARYWAVARPVRLLPAPLRWRWRKAVASYHALKTRRRRDG